MQEADNHYKESQESNDGFIRGQGNRIKFKKGNKKNQDEDGCDDMNMEPIDAIALRNQKKRKLNQGKNKNNKVAVIGNEYKAKNAGGDVKRKGKPDPFAYIPLSNVYKKNNQKKGPKISITSKSKIQKRQTRRKKL